MTVILNITLDSMKCSKCGRDTKGHSKPLGEDCKLPQMSDLEVEAMKLADGETEKTSKDTDSQHNNDNTDKLDPLSASGGIPSEAGDGDTPFLKELATQMSAMNMTMQVLVQSHAELQKDVLNNSRNISLLPYSTAQRQAAHSQPPASSFPLSFPAPAYATTVAPASAHLVAPVLSTATNFTNPATMSSPLAGQPQNGAQASPAISPIVLPHMMHANPSADTKAKALRGEYVQLEDFAPNELLPPNPALEPFADSHGALTLRPKSPKKVLDNFDKWLAAWSNYELLLVQNGHNYAQLAHHRATIQYANRKYYWSVIYAYDVKYRLARGEQHSFDFSQAVGDLYGSCFEAAELKPYAPRCKRCKSTNHMIAECPFPTGEAMEKKPAQTTYQDRWYHGHQEGCNNWNAAKCFYSACKRAHVCKGCRGPQPMLHCTTCQQFPKAQPTSIQGGLGGSR